jgi:hypothetical protein
MGNRTPVIKVQFHLVHWITSSNLFLAWQWVTGDGAKQRKYLSWGRCVILRTKPHSVMNMSVQQVCVFSLHNIPTYILFVTDIWLLDYFILCSIMLLLQYIFNVKLYHLGSFVDFVMLQSFHNCSILSVYYHSFGLQYWSSEIPWRCF